MVTLNIDKLPAEVKRKNDYEIKQVFVKFKEVRKVNLDSNFEFVDTDLRNNSFPKVDTPSEINRFKNKQNGN